MKKTMDEYVMSIVIENPNAAVSWYLITSYAYYSRGASLISDSVYDFICEILLGEYDNLTHPHLSLISKSVLVAGTGFDINNYPRIVRMLAVECIKKAEV